MTILAKPSNKVPVIRVNDREKFVEAFNNSMPSKELLESCEKAGELFGQKIISKRKKQFRESEGGNEEMCDLVENYAKERAEEAAKEATEKAAKEAADSARKFFENGVSYDIVRASISTISDEDLQKIYMQVTDNGN